MVYEVNRPNLVVQKDIDLPNFHINVQAYRNDVFSGHWISQSMKDNVNLASAIARFDTSD